MVTIHLFQSFTPCLAPHIIFELLKDLASSLRAENIQTEMSQFDPSTIHPCLFSLCPAAPQIVNVGILHEGVYHTVRYILGILEVPLL